ncbi:tetratricopeptide repeat protein [Pedobacter heparinus]|uniref:Tetratricopeptide TPR_2 repeat protein n=1 Tax=Pedobacter heparinus (strain ATCC 13125 / DSM 2366 / CIP 104194 / JCM 7457 / NBRC 12017 / NCIMB 9290 / NRRL B-14731 / HIM 762-3) TaxID=485917 RepID=C6Y2F3_PEDHD|nr:tetratricopeptide repeat protein [Pedobacter heparinus]ACU05163.1 Tetratricopeptide TPR_2 repeat protein [Pedobacter heparinus DSM 2366]
MKRIGLLIFTTLIATIAFSQRPSKEQMEADRKRLTEAMQKLNEKTSKMDPKVKKGYDSLLNQYGVGQKMDNAIKQVNEGGPTKSGGVANGLIPAKDTKAIAGIAATPSRVNMGAFIGNTGNTTFAAVLPVAKNKANNIYKDLQQKGASIDEMGNAAAALWVGGRTQIALSLMAQVCKDDANNTDNLNNYAAMLTMTGAPEMAIPLLNNLNGQFKKNSTILNNLGQAWFALGDVDQAKKYLDTTLALAASHSQANQTMCLIAQGNGNKTVAIAAAKTAFKQGYSGTRADLLKNLGYIPGIGDYNNFPLANKNDDLLNLGGFAMPAFPKSVAECKAMDPIWKQFRADIDQRLKALQKTSDASKEQMLNQLEQQKKQFMDVMNKTLANPGSVSQSEAMKIVAAPMYAKKMNAKENVVLQNLQQKKQAAAQSIKEYMNGEGGALKKKYDDAMVVINKKMADVGEGGNTTLDMICRESVKASDAFLKPYNTKLEGLYNDYLAADKQLLNEMAYSSLYTTYPKLLPGINAGLQAQWLKDLSLTQNGGFNFANILKYDCVDDAEGKGGRLTQFKDPNCSINSEFGSSKLGFTMTLTCSGLTTTVNAGVISGTLNQDLDHAGFGDSFKNCTVSIGPKVSAGGKLGPLQASVSAGVGADIEIDRTGVTDVVVAGGVEAAAGVGPAGASAGMEGRMSLNSGSGSLNGTGIFK